MQRGYTFVMVDLRGFGGSTGCLDWGGPGEQADVVKAVEWAAGQSWSTGKVGMYGKSYDGVTGLLGVNQQPAGLAAVVSQEPVYDLYRYLYGDGIRRLNSVADAGAVRPDRPDAGHGAGRARTTTSTALDDTQRPGCPVLNLADQAANDDHYSAYWRKRNLIPGAKGSGVPLFLTQGLTENNTVADGTAQYLDNHTGPERAWLGPWEHVRGNETDEQRAPEDGPRGLLRRGHALLRPYLKGTAPAVQDPPIAVQTNDGKWRAEQSWPPADSAGYTTPLRPGTYSDDGSGSATESDADGVWTISRPLAPRRPLSGAGKAVVDVAATRPNANLVVDVYDLDEYGIGPLITRQGFLARSSGSKTLDLWSADWKLPAGHRIAVRVTDANEDWWIHTPTFDDVKVVGGSVTLPFLSQQRTETIQGDPGTQLEGYLSETVTVPPETMRESVSDFALPPPASRDSGASQARSAGPSRSAEVLAWCQCG